MCTKRGQVQVGRMQAEKSVWLKCMILKSVNDYQSVTKGNIWGFQFQMYFLLVAEFKSQWSASLPSNHNYGDYGEIFLSELISSKYCKISQLSQIGSEVVRLGEWLSQGNFLFGGIKLPNLPRLSISRNMIFTGIRFDYQISVNKKNWLSTFQKILISAVFL